jgi:hypothetical protein
MREYKGLTLVLPVFPVVRLIIRISPISRNPDELAEREGFEPSVELPLRRFSKPVPSAARPPLQSTVFYSVAKIPRRAGDSNSQGREPGGFQDRCLTN